MAQHLLNAVETGDPLKSGIAASMELYQLRGLVAIAAAGNLTRAAATVHVTQPALSAQLKALEDELGVPLFERSATGMAPTAAGRRLIRHAERVLTAARALQDEARTLRGDVTGRIALGTLSDPEFIRLGRLMGEMVARHPLVEVELHQEVTGDAFAGVRDGALDASFYYGDLSDPAVAAVALCPMRYRVVGPAAWQARLATCDWQALAAEPWIIPPAASTHHAMAHGLLAEQGVTPVRVVEADQEAVVSSLVTAGVGVALMREDTAARMQAEGRVCIWGDAMVTTTLWFIHCADRRRDPLIAALLDALAAAWPLPRRGGARP